MRAFIAGLVLGVLLGLSALWLWSNLPRGDLWLIVRAIFEEPVRADLAAQVTERGNLWGLLLSVVVFTAPISAIASVGTHKARADAYQERMGKWGILFVFVAVLGILLGVLLGIVGGSILLAVVGLAVGIIVCYFVSVIGVLIATYIGIRFNITQPNERFVVILSGLGAALIVYVVLSAR